MTDTTNHAPELTADAVVVTPGVQLVPTGAPAGVPAPDAAQAAPQPNYVPQARVDELTAKWRSEQRQSQEYLTRAREAEARLQQLQPNPAEYDDERALMRDTIQHAVQSSQVDADLRRAQELQQSASQSRTDTFAASVESQVLQQMPDFWERFNPLPIPEHTAEMIVNAPNGPLIAMHLAQNPQLAQRLANVHPVSVAYEIGQLSARLTAPAPRHSAAPPPVPTVGGRQPSGSVDLRSMSVEDIAKWQAAEHRA